MKIGHVISSVSYHTMEISESFFLILFNIVRSQNETLLREIAIRENLDVRELLKEFKPTKGHFRKYIQCHRLHLQ